MSSEQARNDQTIRLLVIEDDPNAVALIRRMLTSHLVRFEISECQTLADARQQIDKDAWDAILLDLTLPDSEGLHTFRAIHEAAPSRPLIVLTGHSDESLAIEAVEQGAQDYLVKGRVDSPLLVRSIRYAIGRAEAQAQVWKAYAELENRVQQRTRELSEANQNLQAEIANREEAERKLRQSNARLETALERLKQSQHQLILKERLHALANMASGIAHDFNNALSPVVGLPDLLLQNPDKLKDTALVTRYLDMIRRASQNASRVIRTLRDFYKQQQLSGEFAPVNLNTLIQHILDITKPKWHDLAMARGVSIQIHTALEETPPVQGLENELSEVLTHLVFNAVEALDKDGTITIRTRVRDRQVLLEVEDDGSGMDAEIQRKCMDPLFTTKGKASSGLGLPTVFGIVDAHGGSLTLDSSPGHGTRVRISFPVSEHSAPAGSPAPTPADRTPQDVIPRNLRILAADDEPMIREVLKACLLTDGHHVNMLDDGHALLDHFHPDDYDLVITDRAMPGLSGDRVALAVKERAPAMRVMLLTGFGDLMTASNEIPPGVDLVVAKPFTIDDIRNALHQLLAPRGD